MTLDFPSLIRVRAVVPQLLAGALALIAFTLSPAGALDVPKDEWEKLKSCEERLCGIILGKEKSGKDLRCRISKTWARSTLNKGESKGLSWGFGDARCSLDLNLSRAEIVAALTEKKKTVRIPKHTVNCVVERNNVKKPVRAVLSPKLKFKRGRARKVWIRLKEVEGPADVKGTLWIAANLEDKLGLFHRPLVKSINKFMHQKCAKRYGKGAKK
jgi:hypothetical protein